MCAFTTLKFCTFLQSHFGYGILFLQKKGEKILFFPFFLVSIIPLPASVLPERAQDSLNLPMAVPAVPRNITGLSHRLPVARQLVSSADTQMTPPAYHIRNAWHKKKPCVLINFSIATETIVSGVDPSTIFSMAFGREMHFIPDLPRRAGLAHLLFFCLWKKSLILASLVLSEKSHVLIEAVPVYGCGMAVVLLYYEEFLG